MSLPHCRKLKKPIFLLLASMSLWGSKVYAQTEFSTDYLKIRIDQKGYITSFKNTTKKASGEFSPADKPSPLLSLYSSSHKKYYLPTKAVYNKGKASLALFYANGSVATVKFEPQKMYFRLSLLSLTNRTEIDDIQWGPYHTTIDNLFGDVIGVARDTSAAVNYAIGALALNDATTGGKSTNIGDCAPFQYMIHSPDKKRFPLPADLKEGQLFAIGGDGKNDVAFYSHPEPYYRILYGNSADIDEKGRVSIVYHASDRRKGKTISFSLIPFLPTNKPNHIEVEPLADVDYIGSKIALWGSPDSIALMTVIKNIVKAEGLPYPTVNGKWIKDPAAYLNDVATGGGNCDSVIAYTQRLGFKAVQWEHEPMFGIDRGNKGYIDGFSFEKKPLKYTDGNKSHKDFTDISNPLGIWAGFHTITTALRQGTKDVSPMPSKDLAYQVKRILAKAISPADTVIEVTDPTYLEEIASWEGHTEHLNMIKIGNEIIYYQGVSRTAPYRLQHVKRGYWKTIAGNHSKGDTIYKLQVSIGSGYDGIIPNMKLQDSVAMYYADMSKINGVYYHDWDGQEFLFNQGHGYYAVKRFHRQLFDRAAQHKLPDLRIMGATLSEGSWHYQSVWNVGGGTNMYDVKQRKWGSSTSEGKDLRDVAYANYFPATFGMNFQLTPTSKVADYEHIQAISIGVGATYQLHISKTSVEACPQKDQIFAAIRTWENAKAANAFPNHIKTGLADPSKDWHLEAIDQNHWNLYPMYNGQKGKAIVLSRDVKGGY